MNCRREFRGFQASIETERHWMVPGIRLLLMLLRGNDSVGLLLYFHRCTVASLPFGDRFQAIITNVGRFRDMQSIPRLKRKSEVRLIWIASSYSLSRPSKTRSMSTTFRSLLNPSSPKGRRGTEQNI